MPASGPATKPPASYIGGTWRAEHQKFYFQANVLPGKQTYLGYFPPETAQEGARRYDVVHLLLHGPRANTNFPWSSYSKADFAAAVAYLHSKGINVVAAVVAAREARGKSDWVGITSPSDRSMCYANVRCPVTCLVAGGTRTKKICWSAVPSAEVAARTADCGRLAAQGLLCITNFRASFYTKEQVEEAGKHLIEKGGDRDVIEQNLQDVEQVRPESAARDCTLKPPCCVIATQKVGIQLAGRPAIDPRMRAFLVVEGNTLSLQCQASQSQHPDLVTHFPNCNKAPITIKASP